MARSRRHELMDQARSLARALVAKDVSQQQVRSVLNSLTHGTGDWQERRRVACQILRLSTTTWPSQRSGSTPDQLTTLNKQIVPLLEGELTEVDLVFLLAWTARLVLVKP